MTITITDEQLKSLAPKAFAEMEKKRSRAKPLKSTPSLRLEFGKRLPCDQNPWHLMAVCYGRCWFNKWSNSERNTIEDWINEIA